MIEVAASIAAIIGVSAKELLTKVREVKANRSKSEQQKRARMEAQFASSQNVRNFLGHFYRDARKGGSLEVYGISVNGMDVRTTVYSAQGYLSMNRPALDVPMHVSESANPPDAELPKGLSKYATGIFERLAATEVRLWDAPLYRLHSVGTNPISFIFGETGFLKYRFTSGLLADELADALIAAEGEFTQVRDGLLPIRLEFLPDADSLLSLDRRNCCGGVGVVAAFRRKAPHRDYYIPIQVRSNFVSDGRGLLGVLPKAFHQPLIGSHEEANIHWTALRELYEELFGGKEAETEPTLLRHDWYFDKIPGLKWFKDHDSYACDLVSFGINAVSGNFEHALLLAVQDSAYYDEFGATMEKNWEPARVFWVSTRDREGITKLLVEGNWAPESMFAFTEGLLRLKALDPERVNLPDIRRGLGQL